LGLWIGLPLAPWLTQRLDKRFSWFPDNDSPWIFWIYFLRYLLQGIFLPVLLASFNSMFADISDEVELETGVRRAGVVYASRSFANKVTNAMGAILGGVVLDLIAFPSGATAGSVPAETVWWLGFTEGPATSMLSLTGVLLYLRYDIDRKRHAEIRAGIAARQQAG